MPLSDPRTSQPLKGPVSGWVGFLQPQLCLATVDEEQALSENTQQNHTSRFISESLAFGYDPQRTLLGDYN